METTSGEKVTSQKKIDANRRNARHSTGPKTERGKKAVARNARKHGMLVCEVVGMLPGEDIVELMHLHLELIAEYGPQGQSRNFLSSRLWS